MRHTDLERSLATRPTPLLPDQVGKDHRPFRRPHVFQCDRTSFSAALVAAAFPSMWSEPAPGRQCKGFLHRLRQLDGHKEGWPCPRRTGVGGSEMSAMRGMADYHAQLAIAKGMEVRREEYLDYMTFRANERPLFTEIFGPLIGLKEEWAAQGATPEELDFSAFRYRCPMSGHVPVNTGWIGGDEPVILEETEDYVIARERMGRRVRLAKRQPPCRCRWITRSRTWTTGARSSTTMSSPRSALAKIGKRSPASTARRPGSGGEHSRRVRRAAPAHGRRRAVRGLLRPAGADPRHPEDDRRDGLPGAGPRLGGGAGGRALRARGHGREERPAGRAQAGARVHRAPTTGASGTCCNRAARGCSTRTPTAT